MLTIEDFTDEVLIIEDSHVAAGNDFILLIAAKCGVPADKISNPLTYVAKRIGVLHGYCTCCLDYVGRDPVSHEGYSDEDIYLVKLRVYRTQLSDLQKMATAKDFTGDSVGSTGGGLYCIGVQRA